MPAAGGATGTDDLREALGDPILDPELLSLALTHRSYAYENGNLPTNERLEFLGDSVLGVVITETLYVTNPDLSEGRLAKLRAAVVNARAGRPARGRALPWTGRSCWAMYCRTTLSGAPPTDPANEEPDHSRCARAGSSGRGRGTPAADGGTRRP